MRRTLIQRSRAVRPMEKALVHNVTGAGKSRVKREFFDLDATDIKAMTEELERRVKRNLQR
jgi:hypothetical protein